MDVQPSFVLVVVELGTAFVECAVDCLDKLDVFDFDILGIVAVEVIVDMVEVKQLRNIVLEERIYRFDMGKSSSFCF